MTKSPSYNHPIKPSVGGSGQFSNFVLTVVLPGRRWARAWHRAGALSWNEELLLLLPGLILQRDKLGEGTLHLLLLIFNTLSKKLSRVRSSSVTRPMSWFLVMSDYSDHQVGWGVVAPWQLSAVTVTTLWHILLGWAGLGWATISIFSIPCPVSASTVYTLQRTRSWSWWGIIFILIHGTQLVSVTQSGSYAIMHQKVAYLRKEKNPNSFKHRNSWQVSKIRHQIPERLAGQVFNY